MKRFRFLFFAAVLAGFAALAYAGLDDGKAAYDRAGYAKAYKEFKVSADQKYVKVQFDLGWTYEFGQGVPQNPPTSAKTMKIEFLQGSIDPQKVGELSGLSCRNEDHIVHLNISVDWPTDSITAEKTGYKRLVFWDKKNEYLFPEWSYFYLHGYYIIRGYFIVRSGGMHQGIISYAFEKIDDATIKMNPGVEEIEVTSSDCH